MARHAAWLLAGAFLFFVGIGPAFAAGTGSTPADWEAAFKSRCEARGVSADECDKRFQAMKARRDARMNKMRDECKAQNITNDADCRAWYRKQHAKAGNVNMRGGQACQGLTAEQCDAKRKEMRAQRQAEFEKFQADCKAKGTSDRDCRRQFRQSHRGQGGGMGGGMGPGTGMGPGKGTGMGPGGGMGPGMGGPPASTGQPATPPSNGTAPSTGTDSEKPAGQ